MEALTGPFYGLLCATDPYMELCPHVCYFRQIVDKFLNSYLCFIYFHYLFAPYFVNRFSSVCIFVYVYFFV